MSFQVHLLLCTRDFIFFIFENCILLTDGYFFSLHNFKLFFYIYLCFALFMKYRKNLTEISVGKFNFYLTN